MPDLDELARAAYAAYGQTTGGRNFRGERMPIWQDLGEQIQTAWRSAVAAVLAAAQEDEAEIDTKE